MLPVWFKQSNAYKGVRKTASTMERLLLLGEYALLADRKRKEERLAQISQMPHSNGSRYYRRLPLRIGIVADAFLFQSYFPTAEMIYLTPENWERVLPSLDCVIVTSTWHGLNQEWTGVSTPGTAIAEELCRRMQETRRRGCPILFYSKEDPPNFSCFQEYAKRADCIFTSARECVPKYQAMCPGTPVKTLPFAVSPTIYNPIGMRPLSGEKDILFAGSWMKKYPNRVKEQKQLFEWVRKAGFSLEIADRNYEKYSLRYRYPLRYVHYVMPSFSYVQLADLYKIYNWNLNFNSVSTSADMFSMRVYDTLSCGTLLLSNGSIGMEKKFPQVFAVRTFEDLWQALHLPVEVLEQRRLAGIRQALRIGTVYERMEFMLNSLGIAASAAEHGTVGVVLGNSVTDVVRYREMFDAQTYEKKCWIVSSDDFQAMENCDMIALWGPNRVYGPYYLEDMVNAFKYTDCDYITKGTPRGKSLIHNYTEEIVDPFSTIFWKRSYFEIARELRSGPCRKKNGYVSDLGNYTVYREFADNSVRGGAK